MPTAKKTVAEAAVDAWDFNMWLEEATRPQRYATLYAKNSLQAEIVVLEGELESFNAEDGELYRDTEKLAQLEEQYDALQNSDRMVGGHQKLRDEIAELKKKVEGQRKTSHAAQVEARIEELQQQIAQSGQRFTLQALTEDEQKAIDDAMPLPKKKPGADADEDDEEHTEAVAMVLRERYIAYMAKQIVAPRAFTVDELRMIQDRLGEAEFAKLFMAGQEASAAMSASTPTWRGNSEGARAS